MKDKQIEELSNDIYKLEFYRQLLITIDGLDFPGIEEVRKEIEKLYQKHIKKNLKKQEKILKEITKSIIDD